MPEEINCVLCGDAPSGPAYIIEPREPFDSEMNIGKLPRLVWRRCLKCGLVYLSPRPTLGEAAEIYDEEYADDQHEEDRSEEFRRWIADIEKFVPGGRLLDVGCSFGYFQSLLGPDWQPVGIDFSEVCIAHGRPGLDLRRATFAEFDTPPGSFDAVTMWHFIEHVQDPVADLRLAHRALRPGGALALATGVLSAPVPRFAGKYWYFINIPHHQFAFTEKWMRGTLETIGFEVKVFRILNSTPAHLKMFLRVLAVQAAKSVLGAVWRLTKSRALAERLRHNAPPVCPMFADLCLVVAVKK